MPSTCAGSFTRETGKTAVRKSLIVEGWRFLPHSYAIVNQWQLLAFLRRNITLKVIDAPFYRASWKTQDGLFDHEAEQALRAIERAQPDEAADATFRIVAPFRFSPSRSRLTAVFATLEQQVIRRQQLADSREHERLQHAPPPAHVRAVTPSRWSAEGFRKAGFPADQVIVVPHGVDAETFHPDPHHRQQTRSAMGMGDGEFAFLSIGAMSGNKGVDLLLRSFAEVCRRSRSARLILKGMDQLYGSKALLLRSMATLSTHDQHLVADRLTYIGGAFSHREMARLYQAADAYVSPYRAEGFNMPVLEAAASGLPIICTAGGATDDFVTDAFARRIQSRKETIEVDGQVGSRLSPSAEHLTALMLAVVQDAVWRDQAAQSGPSHVRANYTWAQVADTLVRELLG